MVMEKVGSERGNVQACPELWEAQSEMSKVARNTRQWHRVLIWGELDSMALWEVVCIRELEDVRPEVV